mmetsp:Transcript_6128/g.13556  ORF Transcript_6128/g.13556 Transcript_6128/m.13556 type:complete len:202 (-) Transcript_6128:1970-2575(-)
MGIVCLPLLLETHSSLSGAARYARDGGIYLRDASGLPGARTVFQVQAGHACVDAAAVRGGQADRLPAASRAEHHASPVCPRDCRVHRRNRYRYAVGGCQCTAHRGWAGHSERALQNELDACATLLPRGPSWGRHGGLVFQTLRDADGDRTQEQGCRCALGRRAGRGGRPQLPAHASLLLQRISRNGPQGVQVVAARRRGDR